MFTLLRTLSTRRLLLEQVPALGASVLIAEAFYKFGSFTLEALAFLATWLVADALVQAGGRALGALRRARSAS
jgi:hypothetical protein